MFMMPGKKNEWLSVGVTKCKDKQASGLKYQNLGPVYTLPFSNDNGTKSCRFSLPFTLKCFRNRHQMKAILKTARVEKMYCVL